MNTQYIEEKLWNYIDNECNEIERSQIDVNIKTQPAWKMKYEELLQVHQLIHDSALEEPSLRFTQNVMEAVTNVRLSPAHKTYLNKKIIYSIAGFFIIIITGLLIYGLFHMKGSGTTTTPGLSFDFSKIEWSISWRNSYTNIFMMVNVLLGLMLLDKYLHRKKVRLHDL